MADHTDDRRGADPASTTAPRREPYQSPKLVVYGSLSRLVAMAKDGTRGDGAGVLKTKL
jgi:hypothetical protein